MADGMIAGLMFPNRTLGSSNSALSDNHLDSTLEPFLQTVWEIPLVTEGNAASEGEKMAVYSINSLTGALSGGTTIVPDVESREKITGQFHDRSRGETGFAPNKDFDPNVYVFSIGCKGVLTQLATILRRRKRADSVAVSPTAIRV